jgi:hypothetical protein
MSCTVSRPPADQAWSDRWAGASAGLVGLTKDFAALAKRIENWTGSEEIFGAPHALNQV